jgi:hypothetical protein
MLQDRRWEPRRPVAAGLFAARQVYGRRGASSRSVDLSRSLQISIAGAMGVGLLWLGLASYAAIARHLETIELVRLEGIARTLHSTVEDVRDPQSGEHDAEETAKLLAELTAARAGRGRALTLADAAAAEAAELRREVALANERIGELADALAEAKGDRRSILDRIASLAARGSDGAVVPSAKANGIAPAQPACPPQ